MILESPSLTPPPTVPEIMTAPSRPRLRVLVVDDNRDAADSLALLLRAWNYEPAVAYGGPSALALASADPPAAALLDIGLPGMDGCEVARRLRQAPETARALLIAVTGRGREEDVRRCYEAGIDLHVIKPADPETLHRALDEGLRAR
jgi:CheY-like chemotaxis protein